MFTKLAKKEVDGWELVDPRELHKKHPDTWELISQEQSLNVEKGRLLQLLFDLPNGQERMWVALQEKGEIFEGVFLDDPADNAALDMLPTGKRIYFYPYHVIQIGKNVYTEEDIEAIISFS